jgi:pyocin large subunit-like protein
MAAAEPVGKAPAYDKWEAERDLRTLTDAKAIEKDPGRMANVRRAAKEKLAEMEAFKKYAEGAG